MKKNRFMMYEAFSKKYEEAISPEQFKSIEKGTAVKYSGAPYEVEENDGFILKLKSKKGQTIKVNLAMFNRMGAIL